MRPLTIATCQHDVGGDVKKNLSSILKQISIAKSKHADIVHFPECNLVGYGGFDIPRITKEDFGEVQEALDMVKELAERMEIKVILGSHHFTVNAIKPKNCLYLINEEGEIETRYDKRILTGTEGSMDHVHYSHGDNPVVFTMKGVKCGMLICHEWRYPELYRAYKKMGVEVIFQSWYDGSLDEATYQSEGVNTGELIVGSVRGNAANNYLWISGSNTSKRESCFPSFMVQPDGNILDKLSRNKPGVLISQIDLDKKYEDPSFYGRKGFL